MTKISLIGIAILIGMLSCNNNDDENCSPETVFANWTLGKEINVTYNLEFQRNDYEIVDGNSRLFEYNHIGAQCDDIYDDEWGERLTFKISTETINFELANEDILETNCFYQEYGAWVRHNKYQIKEGTIIGEKISKNRWRISASIITTPLFEDEQPKMIEFSEIFEE